MRTRVRPGLHYAPVPGGVYFGGARTQFVMRGWDLLFAVADVCVPLLEDGATEDELVAALGAEGARPAVRHLTNGLRAHDLLLEPDRLAVPEPPPAVRERHADSLALLESVCAEPYAAFARLRAATVALVGPAEAVSPAARGLARAGVGRVIVNEVPADAAAVLWCVGADQEPSFVDGRPTVVVPVLLDDRVLLAGPAIRDVEDHAMWSAFRARALSWADAEPTAGSARPVADALVGSLAAQLLFEVLAGVAVDGEAHVVHGDDLAADRVVVRRGELAEPVWRPLAGVEPAPMPTQEDGVDIVGSVTVRWTGLLASVPGDTLPQLPLALREVEYRAGQSGSVVAWAANQPSATVAVALAALRGRGPNGTTGAAGLTEEHWLLDGALRLLTEQAEPVHAVSADDLGPEALRRWQELSRSASGRYTMWLRSVPGLDWLLGRVEAADTGAVLGLAWGPDADTAVRDALGTALARTQVRAVTGIEGSVALLHTDCLMFAGDAAIAALRKQIGAIEAADRVECRGRPSHVDVVGDVPLWFGPVEFADAH